MTVVSPWPHRKLYRARANDTHTQPQITGYPVMGKTQRRWLEEEEVTVTAPRRWPSPRRLRRRRRRRIEFVRFGRCIIFVIIIILVLYCYDDVIKNREATSMMMMVWCGICFNRMQVCYTQEIIRIVNIELKITQGGTTMQRYVEILPVIFQSNIIWSVRDRV